MKLSSILKNVTKTLSNVSLVGKAKGPKLVALDKGILEVALMVAALDGTILSEEYAAFENLAKKCRGYSAKNAKACLDSALRKAGLLMAMAQVGAYSVKERVSAFLDMASNVLPVGFEDGSLADLRRAFALWITMGASDGEFSSIERKAIDSLIGMYAEIKKAKAEQLDELKRSLSPSFRVAYGVVPSLNNTELLEPDFVEKVVKIVKLMANPEKVASAEKQLADLISKVAVVDKNGKVAQKSAASLALR